MARLPNWIEIVDEAVVDGEYVLTLRLARFWWARPSFWLAMIKR